MESTSLSSAIASERRPVVASDLGQFESGDAVGCEGQRFAKEVDGFGGSADFDQRARKLVEQLGIVALQPKCLAEGFRRIARVFQGGPGARHV